MSAINIKKLTSEEIQELNVHAAQRMIAENVNILADLGSEIFTASGNFGKAKIELDRLKYCKDIITEQNRALKSVVSGG